MRADADLAHCVDRSDRTTACADFDHLDDGNGNRHAGSLAESIGARDLESLGRLRYLVFDQADLGSRAAHVEGKNRIETVLTGDVGREDRAARWTGFDEAHRKFGGALDRDDPTAGVDHEDRAADADILQRHDETVEIGFDRLLDVGIGTDRVEALEFAHLRRNLRRDRNGEARKALQDRVADGDLVCAIGIGMNEADRDTFIAACRDLLDDGCNRSIVQIKQNLARRIDTLTHDEAVSARDESLRRQGNIEIILLETVLGAHLEHVAKTFRRHEGGPGAAPLDQRVGGKRRAMDEDADL